MGALEWRQGCLKEWHVSMGYPSDLRCPTCKQLYFGPVALALARMNVERIEQQKGGGMKKALSLASAQVTQGDKGTGSG